MWRWIQKRRALRSYRTTLARKLRARYGREAHYTPAQVRSCAADAGVSMTFVCYALAMFCARDTFDADHQLRGETCDYLAMRSQLGGILAEDPASFDAADVIDLAGTEHHAGHDHHDLGHHALGHHDLGHHDLGGHHDPGD